MNLIFIGFLLLLLIAHELKPRKNVQIYLLSQALTRYFMIYLVIYQKRYFFFRVDYILKNQTVKILNFYFYFMDNHNTFSKIKKRGSPH